MTIFNKIDRLHIEVESNKTYNKDFVVSGWAASHDDTQPTMNIKVGDKSYQVKTTEGRPDVIRYYGTAKYTKAYAWSITIPITDISTKGTIITVQFGSSAAEQINAIRDKVSCHYILDYPSATQTQLLNWVMTKHPDQLAIDLLPLYWSVATNMGIDPVLMYCQSMKETGYMKFGGVINATYCNPCGLKKQSGGGDYDKDAHMKFTSWVHGILAMAEHLALYAGKECTPLSVPIDPRHFAYLKGTATTMEELGTKWAPSSSYGTDVVKMIEEVKNTK